MKSPYYRIHNDGEAVVVVTAAEIIPHEEMQDQWRIKVDYETHTAFPNEDKTSEELNSGHAAINPSCSQESFEGLIKSVERKRDGTIVHLDVDGDLVDSETASWLVRDLAVFLLSTVEPVDSGTTSHRFPDDWMYENPS